jgi:hypothetical protein
MMPTKPQSKPLNLHQEGGSPSSLAVVHVLSLGEALVWVFAFIVVCGAGVCAVVTLWGRSLF